jgi:secretion/DNA translocation related TadE-like protein
MASTPGRRRRDERGIATVVAVGLMGMLLSVTTIAVAGTLVAVTAHRAAAAADLAALAGAQAIRDSRSACAAAASSARHNGGEVSDCSVAALDVSVTVQVTTPRVLGLVWSVPADARAGPGGVGGL